MGGISGSPAPGAPMQAAEMYPGFPSPSQNAGQPVFQQPVLGQVVPPYPPGGQPLYQALPYQAPMQPAVMMPVGGPMHVGATTTILPGGATATVVHATMPTGWPPFATEAVCPSCSQQVTTVTSKHAGAGTWFCAGFICLAGGCLGCFLLPFCIDGCKDTEHRCPRCARVLGIGNAGLNSQGYGHHCHHHERCH